MSWTLVLGLPVVRGLEWELEGKWGGNNGDKVKTKKKGENYHDRHAVLYLGFTLTVLGRQVPHLKEIKHVKEKMKMSRHCILQT